MSTQKAPIEAPIVHVDLLKEAADIKYAKSITESKGFLVYNKRFLDLIGSSPTLTDIESRDYEFAHEAGLYIKSTNKVYFTANFQSCDPVELYAIDVGSLQVNKLDYPEVTQANGAVNYKDKILYTCQGTHSIPSSLVLVDPVTSESKTLINNFHGRQFSSLNDVVIHHETDEIWFTDPTYGYEQSFRPAPDLPCMVYRFNPSTGEVWMVADGFSECNGLVFSPDYKKMYITDTGATQAQPNPRNPATIYEYDVIDNGTRLVNRRVFAFADNGVPDGIKCDTEGNIYSACADGVHVWDPKGTLLGKILVGSTCANLCFTKEGMWMMGEKTLWLAKLKSKGALVSLECE